jgi:hypothetical protein
MEPYRHAVGTLGRCFQPTADRLLGTSAAYVSAKFGFERAIRMRGGMVFRMMRSRGWSRSLGFPMIEAAAGKSPYAAKT